MPEEFKDPQILIWIAAIAAVDLMPVPTTMSSVAFSLSFPIELSVALLYPPPVAALIALLGSSDQREFRGQLPILKALFIRAQIAGAVICESLVFKKAVPDVGGDRERSASLPVRPGGDRRDHRLDRRLRVNLTFVAIYNYLANGENPWRFVRQIHVGVFGEFLVAYMALALFSVLVVSGFPKFEAGAIIIFLAPLLFARQMFQRTHSLQKATDELAVKQAENEYQALHDSLTGMPNRMFFHQRLLAEIELARSNDSRMAVILIDLDHFKEINDTLGHHFGDKLLQEVGPRLSSVLRDNDLMARLGGDEFGIILPDLPSEEIALRIADRLIEELEQPVSVEGLALDIAGSIGISLFPMQAEDAEALLRRADVAMYVAKENGGGYEVYQDSFDRNNPQRLTLIGQVRPALETGEFVMFYQPKVRLVDGRVAGAEALIRWEHPTLGLVPPDEFIPLVEKTVLLRPLTQYVAESVLKQWREWANMGIRIPVSINVSPRSLLDQDFPDQIQGLLREHDVPPAFLRIELTEGFLHGGLRAIDRGAGRAVQRRRRSVDRRLRHRVLVAVVPEAAADRGDQDRSLLRDADACGRERLHDRAGHRRPRSQPRPAGGGRGCRGPRHLRPSRGLRLRRGPGLLHLAPDLGGGVHPLDVGAQPRSRGHERAGRSPRHAPQHPARDLSRRAPLHSLRCPCRSRRGLSVLSEGVGCRSRATCRR